MHYLILVVGILIGIYGLYKFFLSANAKQVKAAFTTAAFTIFAFALLYLSITGRLPAALGLLGAISPFLLSHWHKKREKRRTSNGSIKEAQEILNLGDSFTKEDIEKAYKNLMKKVHPDQGGSEALAKQLNQAKDALLSYLETQEKP